mgnify:CR=1 FL=1
MSGRTVQIGTAEAKPGTKAKGVVHVANRPDGSAIYIPVMLVNGVEEGPVLGMDGCTHGDEYEGPEAIQALVAQLEPRQMRGTFVGVPVVNMPAFMAMQRVTPHDALSYPDVNRNYPGRADGGLTGRIAHAHFHEIVAHTDVMISVHSGASFAMLPAKVIYHESDDEYGRRSLEVAKVLGWEILWRSHGSYPGTLHEAAKEKGIVCVATEFGGTDRLPAHRAERTERLLTAATNVMKFLGMLEGEPKLPPRWTVVEGESHVFANHGGLVLYEGDFELGKPVRAGQKLARIVDVYGEELESIASPYDGVLMFLRTVPVVHPGDWVVGVGKQVRVIENRP